MVFSYFYATSYAKTCSVTARVICSSRCMRISQQRQLLPVFSGVFE